MRHLKLEQSAKSKKATYGGTPTKRPRLEAFRPVQLREERPCVSAEDMDRHVKEIATEWLKGPKSRNPNHIKHLLKNTRQDRQDYLSQNSSGAISPLFEKYTCFKDSGFVSTIWYYINNSVFSIWPKPTKFETRYLRERLRYSLASKMNALSSSWAKVFIIR